MTPTHCPLARLAAIEALRDILTQAEWSADPDTALEHLADVPLAMRALVEVLGDEQPTTATPPKSRTGCSTCAHDYHDEIGAPSCARLGGEDPLHREIRGWCNMNLSTDAAFKTATGCPGWKAREPDRLNQIAAELYPREYAAWKAREHDDTATNEIATPTEPLTLAQITRIVAGAQAAITGAAAVAKAMEEPIEELAARLGLTDGDGVYSCAGVPVVEAFGDDWLVHSAEPLVWYPDALTALRAYAKAVGT